jgi:hypothetical protein
LAGSAFKDPEVVKALSKFTPILVDGDTEKEVCAKYGVRGYPNTIFADVKGEAAGPAIVGAVPTDQFLAKAQEFAKKIKAGKPSKDFKTLADAKAELDAAQARKDTAKSLAAIAKIEKVGRPGDLLDAALAAKKTLLEEGRKRLDAAKSSLAGEGKDSALAALRKLAAEYKGTEVGDEASKLVQEAAPPPPAPK